MAKPDEIKNDIAFPKYILGNQKKAKEPEEQKARSKKLRVNCKFTIFYNKTVSLDSKLIALKKRGFLSKHILLLKP
jgi:hypothetical protein